jgi:PAS domain S-box-containing protein
MGDLMISVLYVDDEPALLEIGKQFLEQSGLFSVDTLPSAKEALFSLGSKNYEAIISDYQMPAINGIEFLKQVRASGNTIPFIIFTGRGREEIVIQALNEGADFYLQKGGEPVSQFTELAHKIRQAVQQRKGEASIRDHERREADIINFLPDATFAIDTNGVVIAWNRAMEKMTGVRPSEILGKGNYEYAVPFYHERRPILIDLVLGDDPDSAKKYPVITREGTTLFSEITIPHFNNGRGAALWFTASPLFDTQGEVVGAIESIREITERKMVEVALHESEKFLNSVVENIPDMIFVKDARDLRFVRFNKAGEELLGYSRNDLYGKSDYDLFPKDGADFFIKKDREVLDMRQAIDIPEEKIQTRFRGERILHTKKIPILDETRNPIYLMGISEDITERKLAEETVQQNEIRFRSLIQNASDMIRILDSGGRIVYESPSAVTILGYQVGENIGKDPLTLIHPDDLELVKADLREVYDRTNPGIPTEFRVRKADGTYIWVETIATNLLDVPAINGIVVTTRPIEQRKKLENALRKSEETYRTVFETTGTATVLIENNGTISLANSEFERLSGYPKNEIENRKKWTEFVVQEDLDRMLGQHQLRRQDPQSALTHYEFRFRKRSGEARDIYLTIDVIPGTAKSVASLLDITERNQAEGSLITANQEYTNLLSQIQDIYYRSDTEGRLIKVSQSWVTLLGYDDILECLGRSIADDFYVNPADRKIFLEEVYRNGKVTGYEVLLKKKDGTAVLVATSSHLYYDPAGNILGIEGTFRDITERKQIENALEKSEQRYRTIFEKSMIGIFSSTPEGRFFDINPAFARMFGYDSPKEMTDAISDIQNQLYVHPEDRVTFKEILAREGMVKSYATEFYHRNGNNVWISINGVAVRDDAGSILYYEGTTEDITIRKRAESELKNSVAFLNSLIEQSPYSIAISDEKGVLVRVNKACCEMLQIIPAEVIGKYNFLTDTIVEEQGKMSLVRSVFEEGRTVTFELNYDTSHLKTLALALSTNVILQVTIFPVLDSAGKITNAIIQHINITDRKQAEEKLITAYQEYQSLLDQIQDVYYRSDTEGRLVRISRSMTDLLGYRDTSELLGKNIAEEFYLNPGDREKVLEEINRHGRVTNYEVQLKRTDGTPVTISASSHLWYHPNGTVGGVEGSFRDITEQKRAEQTIQDTNKKINLLTSITRHDVANQVSILRGFAKIAMMKNPDPVVVDLLEKIETAGSAIARQVEFTRTYQELGLHAPGWHRISKIVASGMLENIEIICSCDTLEIFADPMIEKVFFNLFDNAVRHGERVTEITVRCEQNPDGIVIFVEDNGVGVPDDVKEKIFERGYGKHTGFGLFLAREILAITGMTIRETGTPGNGVRFEIAVPLEAYRFAEEPSPPSGREASP